MFPTPGYVCLAKSSGTKKKTSGAENYFVRGEFHANCTSKVLHGISMLPCGTLKKKLSACRILGLSIWNTPWCLVERQEIHWVENGGHPKRIRRKFVTSSKHWNPRWVILTTSTKGWLYIIELRVSGLKLDTARSPNIQSTSINQT